MNKIRDRIEGDVIVKNKSENAQLKVKIYGSQLLYFNLF